MAGTNNHASSLPNYPEQPELALVAAMNLMSRYACCRNPAIAEAAVSQLQCIEQDSRLPLALRENAAMLLGFWQKQAGMAVDRHALH